MKLHSIGLLNWANLENKNYAFRTTTLITGDSGAGKTTLLDAIQTILTGATSGLFQYNPGQQETTQKSRTKLSRTLASYILGCDDGYYSRPNGAHGYIISNWRPEDNERSEPFTAVIGVSAYLDKAGSARTAKEEEILLGVVRNTELLVENFQKTDPDTGKKYVIPIVEIGQHFKDTHPELTFEAARGKEDYLCRLYGAFRGKNSVGKYEARNAAKAVAKFMVYKPLKNLDEFVRQEILEPQDLTDAIRQVSSMMRSINSMEQEANSIENGIRLLKKTDKEIRGFIRNAIVEQLAKYERFDRKVSRMDDIRIETEKELKDSIRKLDRLKQEEINLTGSIGQVSERLQTLEIKRQGFNVLVRKEQLEKELVRHASQWKQHTNQLLTANLSRSRNRQRAVKLEQALKQDQSWLSALQARKCKELLNNLIKKDPWDVLPLEQMLNEKQHEALNECSEQACDIENTHNTLVNELYAQSEFFTKIFFQSQAAINTLLEKQARLEQQIRQLENANQVSYPASVQKAISVIANRYPKADPRVLCDHIEVSNAQWQVAIESLLGKNRFLILVAPDYEARAVKLLENQGLHKSAIVQGKKASADARRCNLAKNSIFNLMRFSHHLAESYFKAGYGSVLQIENVEQLRSVRRGLIKDGTASANYKMFIERIAESDLVFGSEARRRALDAKKEQFNQLRQHYGQELAKFDAIKIWYESAAQMTVLDLSGRFTDVVHTGNAWLDTKRQLDDLDLSKCEQIETQIGQARKNKDGLNASLKKVHQDIGSYGAKIENLNESTRGLCVKKNEILDKRREIETLLKQFAAKWPELNIASAFKKIEENRSEAEPVHHYEGVNFGAGLNDHASAMESAMKEFNLMNIRGRAINYAGFVEQNLIREQDPANRLACFDAACDMAQEIDLVLNFLNNDILASHKEKLSDITRQFNTTFVSHICHSLYNAIRDGKTKLETFNRKLRNHVFGEEHYRFEYSWIPEYLEYANFFKEANLLNTDEELNIFGRTTLSKKSRRIFEQIRAKLLDDDIERSVQDLKRIADYRNYRSYDIKKCLPDRQISLKDYGTGSGGQMETPSYVIRSAGLASALRFEEGFSHLRTVLIDESFSKMDEQRCSAVLDYLANTLGLQILFVVPNKSAGSLHEHVNQLIQVTKLASAKKRGELNTSVMVTSNILKQEQVSQLWSNERVTIVQKAQQLNFLDLLDNKEKETADGQMQTN
ncbi:MAG: AAA family ATPase [Desulfobacteraceae bacterium]|nr:AAA family ATPase [Desulfobacteraceae bacterium]